MLSKEEILKRLKSEGQRMTRIKTEIIDIFVGEEKFIDANELYKKLDTKADISTIYRNLESLVELGLLEYIYEEGKRLYRLHRENDHVHYIVCELCGDKKEIDYCPFEHLRSNIDGYQIKDHKFELSGVCKNCDSKTKK